MPCHHSATFPGSRSLVFHGGRPGTGKRTEERNKIIIDEDNISNIIFFVTRLYKEQFSIGIATPLTRHSGIPVQHSIVLLPVTTLCLFG